jgi:hypothetical protein
MSNFLEKEVDQVLKEAREAGEYNQRGPKTQLKNPRTVLIQFEEQMLRYLDSYSKRKGISRAEAVRRAVEEFLSRPEEGS